MVGFAGLLMIQDLEKTNNYQYELNLGSYRAQNLKDWSREREWEAWIERQFFQNQQNFNRKDKSFVVEGSQDKKIELENLIGSWNQLESERVKLKTKAVQLSKSKLNKEITELKAQARALDQLLMRLASLKPGTVEVPRLSAVSKKPAPEVKPLKLDRSKTATKEASLAKADVIPSPIGKSEDYLVQTAIADMSEMVLNKLDNLDREIDSLKTSGPSGEGFNNLRLEETHVANQSLKIIFSELRSFQTALKNDLSKTHQFIAKMGGHQTELWFHEKNMLMESLGLQRSALSRKMNRLNSESTTTKVSPLYAKITETSLELNQKQVAASFKFLLGGFLLSLLFNLIWEVIAQRKAV